MNTLLHRFSHQPTFASNKIHDVMTQRKQRAIDVTKSIDTTLSFCLLCRLFPFSNGEYIYKNIKYRSGVAVFILLVCSVLCIVDRCWSHYNNLVFLFIDVLSGFICITQCIISLVSACSQKEKELRAYHDILKGVDDRILQFEQDVYRKDRLRCNLIFFGTLLVHLVTLTIEMIAYSSSWSSQFLWLLSLNYYIARLMISMTVLDYMTKLQVYRTRLAVFRERLSEVEHPSRAKVISRRDRKKEIRQEQLPVNLMSCYRLLSALSHIINERFGFKIVMLYTNVAINSVLATYSVIAFRNRTELLYEDAFQLTIFTVDVVGVNLVSVWIIEYVMSIERRFQEILLTLENIIANDATTGCGVERSHDRWRQLLALCRRRPIVFTACGFFPLNYSLLGGLLATMVTYTIMLVQSNKSNGIQLN